MCKPRSTWSHSFPVPVLRSLQVFLLASQPTEAAAGGSPVESLQSHMILTMSHWSSGLLCFPSQGTQVQILWGVLMWNRDSPVSIGACNFTWFSPCLTGPADYLFASRHKGPRFKSPGGTYVKPGFSCKRCLATLVTSTWLIIMASSEAGFVPKPSLGPRADNVIIPLDLTQLSCPGFTLAAGLPSGFTTDGVGWWGGALWRACNLTWFSPCLTGPVDYLFASCHKGLRFISPGGTYVKPGFSCLRCLATVTTSFWHFVLEGCAYLQTGKMDFFVVL
jgi:hypothetical protein